MARTEMTVGCVINTLIRVKDKNRKNLTLEEIEALNHACNILDKNFCLQDIADDLIYDKKECE